MGHNGLCRGHMDSISIIIIAQDNALELGLTIDAIHESYQNLKSLGLSRRLKGIVVIDYASHPSEADLISQRIAKEKSVGWTEIIFERRVISLTPTFAFERAIQLENRLKENTPDPKNWLLFLKPGVLIDANFLRRFVLSPPVSSSASAKKSNPINARVFGDFVICFQDKPRRASQKILQSAQEIFHKYTLKPFFGISVKSEILCFQKYDTRFLSLDWYSKYPKFSIQDVLRDAVKARGWNKILRPDLKYNLFEVEIPTLKIPVTESRT
jgi:hypothetical protein